jgi:hypothetical protein
MLENVMWTQTVYGETVHWSNEACLAVEAYRNRDDVFARRCTISGEELVAGIRNAITPIFERDYNREPTDVECSYGLVASRRRPDWDMYENCLDNLEALVTV